MKTVAMIGGLTGVFFSLFAMLFALVDDSYTLGNFGLLGVLGGIIGIIASFQLYKNKFSPFLLLIAILLGFYGIFYLFLIPAILMAIPMIYQFIRLTREGKVP
ncbi:hypothetical protein [Ornithinibacillus scapharcae]|uniref:hypothetical protein n=1 Tax=Ornithinibacillus scapharcae TaxID=1147159 RepID=UPI000225B081|nr:hypothetical protein [Ornithinibacillus scapharcae]